MKFSKFMASSTGRLLRIVVGLVLVYVGFFVVKHIVGYIIGIVGLVPLLAGIFDFCVFAPLFGMPFSGKAIRAYATKENQKPSNS